MKSSFFRYKNKSGQDLVIVGYGVVEKDGILETTEPVENPNLKIMVDADNKIGIDPVTKKK